MDIKFIEIMSSSYDVYRIDKNNICECNCIIKNAPVDCSSLEDKKSVDLPLVESLLLIIDNYTEIKDENDITLDVNKQDISQILICKEDDTVVLGYVDLTTEKYNMHQTNYIEGNRLYITIEDEI